MNPLIEHFDHFVLPVDDIQQAEEFCINVLGARIPAKKGRPMRMGLNVLQLKAGLRPLTFFVAAGKRIGAYMQSEHRPPHDAIRDAPTYSFETTEQGLKLFIARLQDRRVRFEGPVANPNACAKSAVFFNDPTGNHFAVYVPHAPNSTTDHPRDPGDLLTAVGYLQLEAPDLEKSIRFYAETFGLPVSSRGTNGLSGAPEAILTLPSGQMLILTQAPFSPKGMRLTRTQPGPHLAFFVQASRWDELCGRLDRAGIEHSDRAPEAKGRTAADLDTYFDDPAGYVIQLISALETT